jgi:hypothetical protein
LHLTATEDVAVMKSTLVLILGAVALLAGCGGLPYSDPYASPDFSQQAECERAGGHWNTTASVCDSPHR